MILVFAEHRDSKVRKTTYEALLVGFRIAQARKTGLAAALPGSGTSGLAAELTRFGVDAVYTADDPGLEHYTPDGYSAALAGLAKEHDAEAIVLSATATGKDLAATVAARLETQALQDCVAIAVDANGAVEATRPVFAGKALARVKAPDARPIVISVRPRSVEMQSETGTEGKIVSADIKPDRLRAVVTEIVRTVTETVELTEADVIISGGRGMKGPENYAILEELAKVLNAAVGASRAAVDAGWRDHQFQVGQTGKVVAPTVYIACGISGAIQHLVGMSGSKCIVAINKDPEANIFKVADFGLVGDLFKVVPLLTEEFKKLKASA